jgi:Leucine-rich repeat (LRR) protein
VTAFDNLTCRNLIRIEAANNEISSFAFPPEGLPSLQELVLPRNKLTSLEGIAGAPRLRVLNIDFNEVSSLTGLTEVVKGWGEEGRDASKHGELPLGSLAMISVRNNLLPEDAWHNIDGLAPITSLRVSIHWPLHQSTLLWRCRGNAGPPDWWQRTSKFSVQAQTARA